MKKIVVFISWMFICISLVGCTKVSPAQNNNSPNPYSSPNPFDEGKAIAMVIKDHRDFPSNPSDTETKKLSTGGPQGTTANVKFTTKVEKDREEVYVVTLTKDWGVTVNGIHVKSYWKYNVTPDKVTLFDSVDNDNLPDCMDSIQIYDMDKMIKILK